MSKSLNKSELINVVMNLVEDMQSITDKALEIIYEERGLELSDDDYATVVEGVEKEVLAELTTDDLVDLVSRLIEDEDDALASLDEIVAAFIQDRFGHLLTPDEEEMDDDDDDEQPEMDIETIVNSLHVGYNEVPGVGAGYCNDEKDLQNMKMFVAGALAAHKAGLVAMF